MTKREFRFQNTHQLSKRVYNIGCRNLCDLTMKPTKEGDPRRLISPLRSPGKEQNPPGSQSPGQTPEELARQRALFIELTKGLPKRSAKIEPAALKPRGYHQSDNHRRRRRPDDTTHDQQQTPYTHAISQFRSFIQQELLARGEDIPPQAIVQERLSELATTAISGEARAPVWDRLASAWDALTHDRYQIASTWERRAGFRLHHQYRSTQDPTIKLAHSETLIIGALADAAGSPLTRGISVIEIPQHLRNYELWSVSPEYQQRVGKPAFWLRIWLPWMMGGMCSGLKVVAPRVLSGIVIAEYLLTGTGLGGYIYDAHGNYDLRLMFIAGLVSVCVSFMIYSVVDVFCRVGFGKYVRE
jgi:hypothetical protein